MLPEKCSPKNAPHNKMLPVKMLSIKILPKKCSLGKNAPRKKMLSLKMLPEKNSYVDRVHDSGQPNQSKAIAPPSFWDLSSK